VIIHVLNFEEDVFANKVVMVLTHIHVVAYIGYCSFDIFCIILVSKYIKLFSGKRLQPLS